MKIVIASNNEGKIKEYKELLKPYGFEVLKISDVNVLGEAIESGNTFSENSLIKASYVAKFTNYPIIADDSGLVLKALPSLLGVHSARYLGHDTSYDIKREKIIEQLLNKDHSAYFECCITLLNYDNEIHQFVGKIDGTIASCSKGSNGFGYDPIFIPNGYSKTFAELADDEKNKISHRGLATRKLINFIKENNYEHFINK